MLPIFVSAKIKHGIKSKKEKEKSGYFFPLKLKYFFAKILRGFSWQALTKPQKKPRDPNWELPESLAVGRPLRGPQGFESLKSPARAAAYAEQPSRAHARELKDPRSSVPFPSRPCFNGRLRSLSTEQQLEPAHPPPNPSQGREAGLLSILRLWFQSGSCASRFPTSLQPARPVSV